MISFFVGAFPCGNCLGGIIQVGILRVGDFLVPKKRHIDENNACLCKEGLK